jgi:hypothetical protein
VANALAYYVQVQITQSFKASHSDYTLGLARVEVTETDKHTSLLSHVAKKGSWYTAQLLHPGKLLTVTNTLAYYV